MLSRWVGAIEAGAKTMVSQGCGSSLVVARHRRSRAACAAEHIITHICVSTSESHYGYGYCMPAQNTVWESESFSIISFGEIERNDNLMVVGYH